jgi:hypothetical protein
MLRHVLRPPTFHSLFLFGSPSRFRCRPAGLLPVSYQHSTGRGDHTMAIVREEATPVIPQSETTQINQTTVAGPRYHSLEGTESIYAYRPGGLHPVTIGDILADRYLVVHKLGFGGWSTIWLARDQHHGQYVAVKIALAGTGLEEIRMLQEIHSDAETQAAQSMIPSFSTTS